MAVIPEKLVRIRRYESETNNSNISEKNMTRTYNEYVDIRKHFFDEMSDVVFKKTFGKYLKNSNAESREELECEKAFLLCSPVGQGRTISNVGIEYLINLLQDKITADILESKYELNIKKFYELTGEHLYNDWKVQETIQNIKKKEEVFENEIRRNEQQKLMLKKDIADRDNKIKELEAIIEDYENSTSWKLTKPLRKIGTIVKK